MLLFASNLSFPENRPENCSEYITVKLIYGNEIVRKMKMEFLSQNILIEKVGSGRELYFSWHLVHT